ncbi:hypothetical protein ACLOJK_007321 [Asimina triloba]
MSCCLLVTTLSMEEKRVGHLPCQPSSMQVRKPCEAGENVNGRGLPIGSHLDRGAARAESWQPTLIGTLSVVDPPHAAVGFPWMPPV